MISIESASDLEHTLKIQEKNRKQIKHLATVSSALLECLSALLYIRNGVFVSEPKIIFTTQLQ
jgi:hypothetical protein